jgi:membrane protein YqaA with SNARE-associated domain
MGEGDWANLIAFVTSIGYGVASAIFPMVNAEAYVVLSQVSAVLGALPIAVGLGIGQTIGKLALFYSVRAGKDSRFFRHRRQQSRERRKGPARLRFDAAIAWLLRLVGTKRWGLPIVLVAAIFGIPPLYAVALLAGATTMKAYWFGLMVLIGRITRFILIAEGSLNLSGLLH